MSTVMKGETFTFVTDFDTYFIEIDYSRQYCKTKGYQRSEFIRMLIRDFLKREGWLE